MSTDGIRVLLVEDQFLLRLGLSEYLIDEDYIVFSAQDGEDALRILESQGVDVGIVDIRLPGMNGNEFIHSAHALQPDMRFLILTGSLEYELPESLEACGVTDEDVFHKPLDDLGVVVDAIVRLVSRPR